ncbi:DUF5958 family protein [Streptomyces sviceus]|uniref:DUF5958 family protein n=1 Tax=Streptomyces sviceus TaxID=285530 RepID=UPI00369AE617
MGSWTLLGAIACRRAVREVCSWGARNLSALLHALVEFCGQAHACEDDGPESIARCGIRPTHTPAVMLTKWRFGMTALPAHELTKSFRLLIALFTIADTRWRTQQLRRWVRSRVAQPVGSFLPWVLPGILVTCVLPAHGRWARAPGRRRWSSLAAVSNLGQPMDGPASPHLTDGRHLRSAPSEPQPTTVSHDGGCPDRRRTRVSRWTLTGLSHAANCRRPQRAATAGPLRRCLSHQPGRLQVFGGYSER